MKWVMVLILSLGDDGSKHHCVLEIYLSLTGFNMLLVAASSTGVCTVFNSISPTL